MDSKMTNSQLDPIYPDAKSATSFQDGVEFQDFVCRELAKNGIILQNFSSKKYQFEVGENMQGFEIKLDRRCTETGRLSIEVEERRENGCGPWVPSGIMRDDNTWLYMQGNREVLFIFAKNWLRRLFEEKNPEVAEKMGTVRTFYLPVRIAERFAAKVIRF